MNKSTYNVNKDDSLDKKYIDKYLNKYFFV